MDDESLSYLKENTFATKIKYYGNKAYFRGLIELIYYCKNDCYYFGIRRSNKNTSRYRLNLDQVLEWWETRYEIGYRTFVLQSGEDNYFDKKRWAKMAHLLLIST